MSGLLIRQASGEDTAAVQSLCAQLNPQDYVIATWPRWIALASSVNLVADKGGQIVGCIHAEGVTANEGWIQALRVHPYVQRRGIGSQLLVASQTALRSEGSHIVRASIAAANWPSRRLVRMAGWHVVGHVLRRRAAGQAENAKLIYPPATEQAWRLLGTSVMLASRSHTAHFGLVYFSWTLEYLRDQIRQHALLTSSDGQSLAFLDPTAPPAIGATWIVGILGNLVSMSGLLEGVLAEAAGREHDVIVDSPARASTQRALSLMGFGPPKSDGDFIVVQRVV